MGGNGQGRSGGPFRAWKPPPPGQPGTHCQLPALLSAAKTSRPRRPKGTAGSGQRNRRRHHTPDRVRPAPERQEERRSTPSGPTYDGVPPENIPIEDVEGQVPEAPGDLAVEVFSVERAAKQAERAALVSWAARGGARRITSSRVSTARHAASYVGGVQRRFASWGANAAPAVGPSR